MRGDLNGLYQRSLNYLIDLEVDFDTQIQRVAWKLAHFSYRFEPVHASASK
jgi:hypothetical protein